MKIELDIDDSVESLKVGDIIANKDNSIIGCIFIITDTTISMIVLYSKDTDFCLYNTYNVKADEWHKYKGKITISNQ